MKGTTRKYRKNLRALGVTFPTRGAFHARVDGAIVDAGTITESMLPALEIVSGFATTSSPVPTQTRQNNEPTSNGVSFPDVFRRTERVSTSDGKKRIDYRVVKNPKAGECYFVKHEMDGKMRWVEIVFGAVLIHAA